MKKAVLGNQIRFKRENTLLKGTVVKVNENSVMVEISENDRLKINLPTNQTIVNHKNYSLV
ncbi:DUF2187 domain-containing protein [Bacillus sp. M6-12]|uniref:DUF2187 family protein n=1 Tax=Bacillus sp. M6-12 TaxID=2054166 RepID=UPI000C76CC7F|nr:DUF2187 family protein [Bacillus sp. M6-12]PLS19499.1 DUF2187 domain-containing protein [Bacillus sp. M6-12]